MLAPRLPRLPNLTDSSPRELFAGTSVWEEFEQWHFVGDVGEPTWRNSWGNYTGVNSEFYSDLAFRLDHSGAAVFRGMIDNFDPDPGFSSTICFLPAHYVVAYEGGFSRQTVVMYDKDQAKWVTAKITVGEYNLGEVQIMHGTRQVGPVSLESVYFHTRGRS